MPVIDTANLVQLQKDITKVRNICILAHVDHGKTTLADSLVASNGIISQRMAGKLRYLDNRQDEQERGITMKSSSISLYYQDTQLGKNKDYLINLIDSPGHVDFSSEVSTAVRLCDGAIVVVDVVEGVCPQTRACLQQIYTEHLKPVLVLNKIDRLILEKQMNPLDAYFHISQVLEQVNAALGSVFASDILAKEDTSKKDNYESALEDVDDSALYFTPENGNVVFCSAVDGWAFSVGDFSATYAEKLEMPREELEKVLWGDFYYNSKKKCAMPGAQEKAKKPMFVQFVLENIWNLYDIIVVRKDKEKLPAIAEKLGIKLSPRDLKMGDVKTQIKAVIGQWLPVDRSILEMVVRHIPEPNVISDERAERLLFPTNVELTTYPKETLAFKEEFKKCDAKSENVVAFISKMTSYHVSQLPENKPKRMTEQEMQDRREIIRQKIQERKRLAEEAALDKITTGVQELTTESVPEIITQEIEQDDKKEFVFVAFARVFSGTLKIGQKLYILAPKHDPRRKTENITDSPYITEVTIGELYLFMGGDLQHLDEAPAGNIVGIGGLENDVIKTATLSSTPFCPSFSELTVMATPILRVAIETVNPLDMPKLVKGLKLLNQADACVQVSVEPTGEHVITTLGEVHVEKCVRDLEENYAKVKLNVSKPIVSFRETIVPEATIDMVNEAIIKTANDKDITKKIVTLQTTNKLGTVKIIALPLPESVVNILEKYTSVFKELANMTKTTVMSEKYKLILEQIKKSLANALNEFDLKIISNQTDLVNCIWSIGPRKCGTNILLNLTDYEHPSFWLDDSSTISNLNTIHDVRKDYDSSFVNGFQLTTAAGPLCDEPMQGVCFVVLDWSVESSEDLNSKSYGPFSGQVMSMAKEACKQAFRNQPQRLVTPMYSCNIIVNAEVLEIQKLQYLKTSVCGKAASLIKHLPIDPKGFASGWKILTDRFQNQRKLVNTHLRRLVEQKKLVSETAAGLKALHDTSIECIHALTNLDIAVDTWDPILIYIIFNKLPPQTQLDWEEKLGTSKDLPDWKTFLSFIEGRFSSLENISELYNFPKSVQPVSFRKTISANCHLAAPTQQSTKNYACRLCKASHGVRHCKKFLQMDVKNRVAIVKKIGVCGNCLGYDHHASVCSSSNRCQKCGHKHHTLLHIEAQPVQNPTATHDQQYHQLNHQNNRQFSPQTHFVQNSQHVQFKASDVEPTSSHTFSSHLKQPQSKTLLATALVKACASNGRQCILRAFIDTGSEATFITENASQLLNLRRKTVSAKVTGLGQTLAGSSKHEVTLNLHSLTNPTFSVEINAFVLPVLTSMLPTNQIQREWKHLVDLPLADPTYYLPGKIDLLLGADVYSSVILDGLLKGQEGSPMAQRTEFGWILSGKINTSPTISCFTVQNHSNALETQLKRFWEIEENLDERRLSIDEERCQKHFLETVQRKEDGRYIVRLPFKNGIRPNLGNSKKAAMARAFQIERKLLSNQKLQEAYTKCIQEYSSLGHMKEVQTNIEMGSHYYLPHHAVIKEASSTTKLRVVFDASCKTSNGLSLNDCLMVGPRLQLDIIDLIARWRKFKIAFVADISMMYRQIWVAEEDTPYQLILWRTSPNDPMKTYALNTVTFGTASAPYLAVRTLHQLASDVEDQYPDVSKVITEGFYVDDLIYGTDEETEAIKLQEDIIKTLKSAGFPLRKWASNSLKLLERVPEEEREISLPFNFDSLDAVKTLGIQWHPSKDTFGFKINLPESDVETVTKRTILADIARLFDPLGWIAPCIIRAKLILQQLWLQEYSWDSKISLETKNQWLELRSGLKILQDIEIPRWIAYSTPSEVQLHGFSDASEKGYAAVIYARIITDGNEHVHLLAAKTRVAPSKTKCVSLPRLELCAALLLARLLQRIKKAMQFQNAETFAWSDSSITLAWIRGSPGLRTTFVANRVTEIQTLTNIEIWRHVSTKENPADIGSRGLLPLELVTSHMWWHGPKFLKHFSLNNIPNAPIEETSIETKRVNKKKQVNTCFYQEKLVNIHTNFAQLVCSCSVLSVVYVQRYSKFNRLVRSAAIWRRYFQYLKDKSNRRSLKENPITVDELYSAKYQLVRIVQNELFPREIGCLKENKNIPRGSPILSLNPFLDAQDVLRVGGRLTYSNLSFNQKHPIILSGSHHFATLVVSESHQRTLHGGQQMMIAEIRREYWITNLKRLVKSTIHKCVRCHRHNAKMQQQLMGSLPEERVKISRPFTNTGVDYAGPIETKMWKGRCNRMTKGYIAVFVCLATKAIHIELVSDLTAAAFIAAFRRFVARRGICQNVFSDCGTNFKGATTELNEDGKHIIKEWTSEVSANLATQGTKWHFNPPSSPHFGGLWEAGVKSIKHHIKRTIGNSKLTFEEYATLLTQIEACLNSRPLCPLTSDPNDLSVLTPGHFLIGGPLIAIPGRNLMEKNINNLDRWRYIQRLTQDFWKQWSMTYLHLLQHRPKWLQKQPNIKLGDIVLVKENNTPPTLWIIARVVELHPGADGLTRVVTIKTERGIMKRPIAKLSPLPITNPSNVNELN